MDNIGKISNSKVKVIRDEGGHIVRLPGGILCQIEDKNGNVTVEVVPQFNLNENYAEEIPKNIENKENVLEVTDLSKVRKNFSNTPKKTAKRLWDRDDTGKLLQLYYENINQIGPFKKFKTKKSMWVFIATMLSEFSGIDIDWVQCENKYKNLAKARKDALLHNRKSGNEPQNVEFDDEFALIESIDDTYEPEFLQGVGVCHKRDKALQPSTSKASLPCTSKSSTETMPAPKKRRTAEEIAESIYERKEAAKDRRHMEKMNLLKELFTMSNSAKRES